MTTLKNFIRMECFLTRDEMGHYIQMQKYVYLDSAYGFNYETIRNRNSYSIKKRTLKDVYNYFFNKSKDPISKKYTIWNLF